MPESCEDIVERLDGAMSTTLEWGIVKYYVPPSPNPNISAQSFGTFLIRFGMNSTISG